MVMSNIGSAAALGNAMEYEESFTTIIATTNLNATTSAATTTTATTTTATTITTVTTTAATSTAVTNSAATTTRVSTNASFTDITTIVNDSSSESSESPSSENLSYLSRDFFWNGPDRTKDGVVEIAAQELTPKGQADLMHKIYGFFSDITDPANALATWLLGFVKRYLDWKML